MTRKDFEAVAFRIKRNRVAFAAEPAAQMALAALAQDIAHDFGVAYPRFDRQRFLDATRPEPPKTQTQPAVTDTAA